MKKLFYILVLLLVCSLSFSACTEESVKPQDTGSSGGGGVSDPIVK